MLRSYFGVWSVTRFGLFAFFLSSLTTGTVRRPGQVLVYLRRSPLVAGTSVFRFYLRRRAFRFLASRLVVADRLDLWSMCPTVSMLFCVFLCFAGAFLVDGVAPTDSHFVVIWIFSFRKRRLLCFSGRDARSVCRRRRFRFGEPLSSEQHV